MRNQNCTMCWFALRSERVKNVPRLLLHLVNPLNKWLKKIGLFFECFLNKQCWPKGHFMNSVFFQDYIFYQLLAAHKITHVWNWELFFQSKAIATKLTATKFITTTTPCNRCQPISFGIKVRFFHSLTPATHARNCVLKKLLRMNSFHSNLSIANSIWNLCTFCPTATVPIVLWGFCK